MARKTTYPTRGVGLFEKEVKKKKKHKILEQETYELLTTADAFKRKAIINQLVDLDKYLVCSYMFTRTKLSSRLSYDRNKRKTPKYKYSYSVESAYYRSDNTVYYYYKLSDIIDLLTPELCEKK